MKIPSMEFDSENRFYLLHCQSGRCALPAKVIEYLENTMEAFIFWYLYLLKVAGITKKYYDFHATHTSSVLDVKM